MTSPPFVQVVIVNYRTPALVVNCLRSLEPEIRAFGNARVAVVENASGDGSAEIIGQAIRDNDWSSWAQLMPSPINGGFAYGNNFAIAPALASDNPPDYFWLLNPDTVVPAGALNPLVNFLKAHPQVGICGGGVTAEDGTPWPFAFRFPGILSELEHGLRFGPTSNLLRRWTSAREMTEKAECVDWICGATMMIRREVFETVGLMDQEYFLYYEETDYCLQAKRAGFECWYVPQSRIVHIAGQSTGVTGHSDRPRRLPRYWFDSRRRYFIKNHGRLYAAAVDITSMIAILLASIRQRLQFKPSDIPPRYLTDLFRNSALLNSRIDGGVVPKGNGP